MGEMIGALLAARGVKPRKVSAKRSWPPGCGRFPAAGDDDKGGTEEAGVSPAACNGGSPHALPQPELDREVDEWSYGEEALLPGDCQGHSSVAAVDVMPLVFSAPQSCAAAATTGSVGNGPDLLLSEGNGAQGSPQLVRKEVSGDGGGMEMKGRAADGEFESKEEGGLSQPELESVIDQRRDDEEALPPGDDQQQSRVAAIDVMPLAFAPPQSCAVSAASGSVENIGDGPDLLLTKGKESGQLFGEEEVPGDWNGKEMGGRADDGESEIKEDGGRKKRWLMSVMNPPPKRRVVSAIRRFPAGCGRDDFTDPGSGGVEWFDEETEGKGMEVEGAGKAHSIVHMKTKGKRLESDKTNEIFPDDAGVSREGKMRNKAPSTQRGVVHSSINMKQDVVDRKLKHDGKSKGNLNRSAAKESKCGNHVVTTEIRNNDGPELAPGRLIVQALMAPDQCPWTQGRKSVGSVSQSNKKKGVLAPKLKREDTGKDTLSTSAKEVNNIENHVVTAQIGENDDLVRVTKSQIVQALMAPDICPWTQGRKSTAGTPRTKLKKKDAGPRK